MSNEKAIKLLKAHGHGYTYFKGRLLAIEETIYTGTNQGVINEATDITGWSMSKLMGWLGY